MYRGHLMNCEAAGCKMEHRCVLARRPTPCGSNLELQDNMNAMLEGVTVTGRDGKAIASTLEKLVPKTKWKPEVVAHWKTTGRR